MEVVMDLKNNEKRGLGGSNKFGVKEMKL